MPPRSSTDSLPATTVQRRTRPNALIGGIIAVTIGCVLTIPLLSLSAYGDEVAAVHPQPTISTGTP